MIWIDAQLSPAIAQWIRENFQLESKALRELGLRDADDPLIFKEAQKKNAIILTKDSDFIDLQNKSDSPSKIILLTCGNTSNERLKTILSGKLIEALKLLETSDLVEISD